MEGRRALLAPPMLFAIGFLLIFLLGGHHRRDGRGAAVRLAGDRQLLRRRALPLRAQRRGRVPDLRRALLLAAEDDRSHARRAARARSASGRCSSASTSRSSRCTSSGSSACRAASTPTTRGSAGTGSTSFISVALVRVRRRHAAHALQLRAEPLPRARPRRPTRGTATRSSGRPRRRHPSTTSPPCPW